MYNLAKLLIKALKVCDMENIPYREITGISMNKRLSKAWGRCINEKGKYRIEIRKIVADNNVTPEKSIMEIILHEIIHTCEGCWNHGDLFKQYGDKLEKHGYYGVGSATTSVAKMEINEEVYTQKSKYAIRCPKCGYTIGKDRMCNLIKYPNFYTHKACGESFERIK